MAKPKRGSSSGPKKKHGVKKHLFKEYKPMIHVFAKTGILSKYYNYESWCLACASKGKKDTTKSEFAKFYTLTLEGKKEYFKNLSE